jgi:hypothetical protein
LSHWSQRTQTIYSASSAINGASFRASVDERNVASGRLLQRLGFRITDTSDPRKSQ